MDVGHFDELVGVVHQLVEVEDIGVPVAGRRTVCDLVALMAKPARTKPSI